MGDVADARAVPALIPPPSPTRRRSRRWRSPLRPWLDLLAGAALSLPARGRARGHHRRSTFCSSRRRAPPTRPEPLLLLSLTAAAYLADTWRVTGKARYLAGAAMAAGRACASDAHQRLRRLHLPRNLCPVAPAADEWARSNRLHRVSGRREALAGLVIFAAPSPSAVIALFSEYAGDRGTLHLLAGRGGAFRLPAAPGADAVRCSLLRRGRSLGRLWRERRGAIGKGAAFARRYSTIVMLGLAAFIGLALLPSATWSKYLVYYLPALAVFAALAYERERPNRWAGCGRGAADACGDRRGVGGLVRLARPGGGVDIGGPGRGRGGGDAVLRRVGLRSAGVVGRRASCCWLSCGWGQTAADHNAYNNVVAAARARAAEIGGGVVVAGPPNAGLGFRAGTTFHPIMHPVV